MKPALTFTDNIRTHFVPGTICILISLQLIENKKLGVQCMKLTIFGRKKEMEIMQGEIDRKLEAALPDCRLVDISVATSGQRMVKSKEEIEVFVIIITGIPLP